MSQETIKKCPYCGEDLPHHKNCAAYSCAWPPFTNQETIKIDDLQRVELRKNDALIVKLPRHVLPEYIKHLAETFKAIFPNNEIVVMDKDTEIFVVSPGEQPPDIVADFDLMCALATSEQPPEDVDVNANTDAIARRAL